MSRPLPPGEPLKPAPWLTRQTLPGTSRTLVFTMVFASFALVLVSAIDLRACAFLWRPERLPDIAQAAPLPVLHVSDAAWLFVGSVVTACVINYRAGKVTDRVSFAYERKNGYYRLGENDPYYDTRPPEGGV